MSKSVWMRKVELTLRPEDPKKKKKPEDPKQGTWLWSSPRILKNPLKGNLSISNNSYQAFIKKRHFFQYGGATCGFVKKHKLYFYNLNKGHF